MRLAQHAAVAEDVELIRISNPAMLVELGDQIRGIAHDRPQARLALRQRLLRQPAICDVEHQADRVHHLAVGVALKHRCAIMDPAPRAVAVQHPVLDVEYVIVIRRRQPRDEPRDQSPFVGMHPALPQFLARNQELGRIDAEQLLGASVDVYRAIRHQIPDERHGWRSLDDMRQQLTLFGERFGRQLAFRDIDGGAQRLMQAPVRQTPEDRAARRDPAVRAVPAQHAIFHLADHVVALLSQPRDMMRHVLGVVRMHDSRLHIALKRHHFGGAVAQQFFHARIDVRDALRNMIVDEHHGRRSVLNPLQQLLALLERLLQRLPPRNVAGEE